ncbi:MAG: helicase C-terminal domain-containing protein [Eubacteriales bacterium]|nr:helicase C-terminal domain-containing protein [Eubacteriales bacterium]
MAETDHKQIKASISVRRLAELTNRSGGLATADYAAIEGIEGLKAQERALAWLAQQAPFVSFDLQPEVSLEGDVATAYGALQVRGRADALLVSPQEIRVVEVKSFRGPKMKLSAQGKEVHWAQAFLYAALLAQEAVLPPATCHIYLLYASVEAEDYLLLEQVKTGAELVEFLHEAASKYLSKIVNLLAWQGRRNASLQAARFPYEELRSGQLQAMREVVAALRDCRTLFIEAPTGIGKTMAVLYPALKALSKDYVKRIFYATAMTSTRDQAVEALRLLREKSACLIRSLRLTAKEKICLEPSLFCEQQLCPYAVKYFDRLPDALTDLLAYEELEADLIQAVASKHQVCPFELSLDMAWYCDVIIGDYNHVFDPRTRIRRFFDEEAKEASAILVDEAHNLAARSRTMFSAGLSRKNLSILLKLWQDPSYLEFSTPYTALRAALLAVLTCLDAIKEIFDLGSMETALSSPSFALDANPLISQSLKEDWVLQGDFLGLKPLPDKLLHQLNYLTRELRLFLDEQRDFPGRRDFLLLLFDLLHWQNMANNFYGESYLTGLRRSEEDLHMALLCLDASPFISQVFYDQHPSVFFSATLYPLSYYQALLYAPLKSDPPESLVLPSPFPRENRLFLLDTSASLKYEDRPYSLDQVREIIYTACAGKIANYLVFVPSYAYLNELVKNLKAHARPERTQIIMQRTGMSEAAKSQFLQRFSQHGEQTLIGLAVLGGAFSEGVDLAGEALSGVICLGVGLPGISPERQLLAEYSEKHFGSGFLFAYVFPAWQRIQQAYGRLIRSEKDRGFILLVDRRWKAEPYRSLISPDLDAHYLLNLEDLATSLEIFWEA